VRIVAPASCLHPPFCSWNAQHANGEAAIATDPSLFPSPIGLMASETAEVVNRCDAAKATSLLDLSHCKLTAVPQAVFFLLKGTALSEVDLSWNELKKLSPKVGSSEAFSSVTSKFAERWRACVLGGKRGGRGQERIILIT